MTEAPQKRRVVRQIGRDLWLLFVDEGFGPRPTWVDDPRKATTFTGLHSAAALRPVLHDIAVISEESPA